jgi:hypothetical protein
MSEQVISGIGFGVGGITGSSLLLVEGDGGLKLVEASKLVPDGSRCDWEQIESLMGGYEHPLSDAEKADFGPNPRACRVRITVETEPLSEAETEEILKRVRDRRARDRSAP